MRLVVLVHRWLGITFCLLFIAWFASGIVMIYARMPELSSSRRLALQPPLDLSSARLSPAEAAERHHLVPQRAVVTMVAHRPAYRFTTDGRTVVVFADSGERFAGLSTEQARVQTEELLHSGLPVHYDVRIMQPDQWTLQSRALLPLHRVKMPAGRVAYWSDVTGQLALMTTPGERRIAYAGAVLHWLYFTPLRRNGALWTQTIIWLSVAGSVMCALGLVWGLSVGWRSPYRGWMQWHHYAGLFFGVITFTWVFSGLLSMDPWDWHPDTAPTRAQREAFSGGALRLDRVSLAQLRTDAANSASPSIDAPREIDIAQFRGEPLLIADNRPTPPIDRGVLTAAAREAMPGVAIQDAVWLESYDAYYYGRDAVDGARPLPVLRVRYSDPTQTWLYIDPRHGSILRKEERLSRLNRWLYHGLHSLDFPWLYAQRPLWDAVVIVLSVGGIASAVTAVVPAWRRLRRHAQRLYT